MVSIDVRRHRLISSDYIKTLPCHGRGREFRVSSSPPFIPKELGLARKGRIPRPFCALFSSAYEAVASCPAMHDPPPALRKDQQHHRRLCPMLRRSNRAASEVGSGNGTPKTSHHIRVTLVASSPQQSTDPMFNTTGRLESLPPPCHIVKATGRLESARWQNAA